MGNKRWWRRRHKTRRAMRITRRSSKLQSQGEKSRVAHEKDYGIGTVVVVAFDNVLSMFSALTDVTVKM